MKVKTTDFANGGKDFCLENGGAAFSFGFLPNLDKTQLATMLMASVPLN